MEINECEAYPQERRQIVGITHTLTHKRKQIKVNDVDRSSSDKKKYVQHTVQYWRNYKKSNFFEKKTLDLRARLISHISAALVRTNTHTHTHFHTCSVSYLSVNIAYAAWEYSIFPPYSVRTIVVCVIIAF